MNDSWWFQTCSKKMIPVPIVPDISVITPTERHIFFVLGDGKLNQGFSKNTCRVHCLHGFFDATVASGFPPVSDPDPRPHILKMRFATPPGQKHLAP
jgi:hypothetical protein